MPAITIWVNNQQQQHEFFIIDGFMCNSDDECLLCYFHRATEFPLKCAPLENWQNSRNRELRVVFAETPPSTKKHNEELSNISTLFPPTIAVKFSALGTLPPSDELSKWIMKGFQFQQVLKLLEESALAAITATSTICGVIMKKAHQAALTKWFWGCKKWKCN